MFQGSLKQTDRALDLAVNGLGFYVLQNLKNVENHILQEMVVLTY